jgi:subtilase family protein
MPPKITKARKPKTKAKVRRIMKPLRPANYTPRLIVKFYQDVDLPEDNAALQQLLEEGKLGPWTRLKDKGIKIQRLITKLSPQSCSDLLNKAKQLDPAFHPHRFDTYFVVTFPPGVDHIEVKRVFDSWQTIEDAYIESGPTKPPQVNRMGSTYGARQYYLDPAPGGIDAAYAWTKQGGDGAGVGVQFVDVEQGWTIQPRFPYDHENLPPGISLIYGYNFNWFGHGTAVLSIVVGRDNNTGVVGITPKLPNTNTRVASICSNDSGTFNRHEAIWSAIEELNFGDVLLIEDQIESEGYYPTSLGGYGTGSYQNLPVEFDNAIFKAIQYATSTAKGIIVIEAAGNGQVDLDHFESSSSLYWGKEDSGAIIVAAASVPAPSRAISSTYSPLVTNYGNRIDCFSWGEQICVAGDGTSGSGPKDYVQGFGGTSGAAAIIAGAALALQSIAEAKTNPKGRFSPTQLRDLFKKLGTPSKDPPNDKIGVMPDLKKILQSLGM